MDIAVNDGAIDPGADGVDASFILGEPVTGRFVARKICTIGYAVCAAPVYLEIHGEPRKCPISPNTGVSTTSRPRSGRQRVWTLSSHGEEVSVPVSSVLSANDIQAIHQAALSGAGLAYLMDIPDRR